MMRAASLAAVVAVAAMSVACDRAPGRPAAGAAHGRPDTLLDFAALYRANCSGCHGPDGRGGAAMPLANPVYLAVAPDDALRSVVATGIAGTSMPAFARAAGGMLADAQIDAIVTGIRTHWADPAAMAGQSLPPYADAAAGDSDRGQRVFVTYCASCHGITGQGGERASSIVDGAYLSLVSNQALRTTIIAGRPDLGAPDWRNNRRGPAMTSQEIADVVAWLAAKRPQ